MIEVRETGLVYRNPRPELRSRHTWHPTLVRFDDGELLVTFDIAEADVALDYRTYASHSPDGGATWSSPTRLLPDPPGRPTTHSVRTNRVSDGSVVAMGGLAYRDDPEKSVVNVPTLGYTEMELILTRSVDRGRTWGAMERIAPPLVGPAFEVCHSVVELSDGRWVWPTSTWMGWDGDAPNGMNGILLVSEDQGRTWPSYVTDFDRWSENILHWEQSFLELRDGRWLAVAWAVDLDTNQTLPTPYAVGRDGRTFDHHGQTGFLAQTTKLIELPDGRILAVYRRNDEAGLWATVARLDGDRWENLETAPLWRGAPSGMSGATNPGDELAQLKFGFPQMVLEPDGTVFLVFWCEEDCIKNVRWLRLAV
jgi:sialidase-1